MVVAQLLHDNEMEMLAMLAMLENPGEDILQLEAWAAHLAIRLLAAWRKQSQQGLKSEQVLLGKQGLRSGRGPFVCPPPELLMAVDGWLQCRAPVVRVASKGQEAVLPPAGGRR